MAVINMTIYKEKKVKNFCKVLLFVLAILISAISGNECIDSDNRINFKTNNCPSTIQQYVIGAPLAYIDYSIQNDQDCDDSDVRYNICSYSGSSDSSSFFSQKQTNQPYNSYDYCKWFTDDLTKDGFSYTVTQTGYVDSGGGSTEYTETCTFSVQLTAAAGCSSSPEDPIKISKGSKSTQNYQPGDPTASVTVAPFTEDSIYCTQGDIVYTGAITTSPSSLSTSFINFDTSSLVASWQTDTCSQIGTYTIQITGTIYALKTFSSTLTFSLVVGSCKCSTETFSIIGSAAADQTYTVYSSTGSYSLSAFTVGSNTYCTQSNIDYTMTVTPQTPSQSTTFIILTQASRTATWVTSSPSDLGVFTIAVIGTIYTTTPPTHIKTVTFKLTVSGPPCGQSQETISITASTAPTAQKYVAGASTSSLTISQFTEDSVFCSQSNIVYSMSVASTGGGSTSFITFTQSSRLVSWQSNNNAQAGTYTITITGLITAVSTWSQTVQFTLTVTASCSASTETDSLVASAAPSGQSYAVGDALASLIVTQFTESSIYCSQSDIVYSMTVTPSTVGLSTNFITFSSSSRIVTWQTSNNAQVGTYSIKITGIITAATTWIENVLFTLTVTSTCSYSTESNQLIASSDPSGQTYYVGNPETQVNFSEFTETSLYCQQSDIVYSMSSNPSISFIQFDLSTRSVRWSTSNNANAGTYTITLTGQITAAAIWTKTNSFTLTVVGVCSKSTETIQITAGTSITTQNYAVGSSSASITVPQFSEDSTVCTQANIIYSMAITPATSGISTSFITFTQNSRVVAWQTSSVLQVGTYLIVVTGTISAVTTWSQSTQFTLFVYNCPLSPETITINSVNVPSAKSYIAGAAQGSQIITQFNENSVVCTPADIVYSMSVTSQPIGISTTFLQFSETTREVKWATCDNSQQGSYTITVIGAITAAQTWIQSTSFVLTVTPSCYCSSESNFINASQSPSDQLYAVGSSSVALIIAQFSENSIFCTQADIIYSMIVNPATSGLLTTFITFTPSTRQVTWQTNQNTQVDIYTIIITGKITTETQTWSQSTQFQLTVTPTCSYSQETINLFIVTSPEAQTYLVGSVDASQTIAQFTTDSIYCFQSEIVYSMGISTSVVVTTPFIFFMPSTRVVSWQTNSNLMRGEYTITISGTMNAASQWSQTTQFILKVQDVCDWSIGFTVIAPANLTNTASETLTYIQGQEQFYQTIFNFTENDAICTENDIRNTMLVFPTTPGQSFSFISFDSLRNVVSWYTNDENDAGVYTIQITGCIQATGSNYGSCASLNFTLIVLAATCGTTSEVINLTAPAQPKNQLYYIQQDDSQAVAGELTISNFGENSTFCSPDDITYKMIVTPGDSGFITFNSAKKLISWFSQSKLNVGNYSIQIQANLRDYNKSISFVLEVKEQPVNNPPVLSGLMTFYPSISLSDLKDDAVNFGPITDPDEGDTVTLMYTVSPAIGNSYFQIDRFTGIFLVTDKKSLLSSTITSYYIKVFLKDQNIELLRNSTYIINFEVLTQKLNQTKNKTENQYFSNFTQQNQNLSTIQDKSFIAPYWKTMMVNNQGQVKVFFSEQLVIPSNATVNIDKTILNLKLISQSTAYTKYQQFQWNLTEFTNQYMTLQIDFKNPLYISALGKNQLDQLQITCLDNSPFISKKSLQPIDSNSLIQKLIPPQLSSNKAANAKMESVKKTMEQGSNAIVIGTFITNLLLSTSINLLWGMINALQIIGNMPNLNLYVPANVIDFYTYINNLQSFKFLPTDKIFEWLGLESDSVTTQNNSNRLLEKQIDVKATENLFQQLGPLFLVLILFLFSMIVLFGLYLLRILSDHSTTVKKLYATIKYKLFWNSTLRYIIESYLSLTLNSLTLISQGMDWSTGINRGQAVFAIITLIICTIAPVWMTVFFAIKIKEFQQKDFLLKFKSVMGDFNWREKQSSTFISIFCYRRLILAMLIVFMSRWPFAQCQLLTLSCCFVIILFGYSNCFRMSRNRRLEFFNEATILICCYHTFLFTEFVDDPIMRYSMGYSLIGFTVLNIAVNICLMMMETGKSLLRVFKVIRFKYRGWRHRKRSEKKLSLKPKTDWMALYMTKEALDEQTKKIAKEFEFYYQQFPEEREVEKIKVGGTKQLTERKQVRKLRRKQNARVTQQVQNQLIVIKEVESELESDRKSANQGIPVKLKKTQKITSGMIFVVPGEELKQQWPVDGQQMLYSDPISTPKMTEASKLTKAKLKTNHLGKQVANFNFHSTELLQDIWQTEQEKLTTANQTPQYLAESPVAKVNNYGWISTELKIVKDEESKVEKSGIEEKQIDPEYTFAVFQEKGKY